MRFTHHKAVAVDQERDRALTERMYAIFGKQWRLAARTDPMLDLVLTAAVARDVARKSRVGVARATAEHSIADLVRPGGPRNHQIAPGQLHQGLVETIRRLASEYPEGGILGMPIRREDMREDVKIEAERIETRFYLDAAWAVLTDEQRAALAQRAHRSVLRMLDAPTLEPRLREVVMSFAATAIAEQLAAHEAAIVEKVRAEVDARWEEHVEQLVRARVDEAIKRVRAELSK